MKRLHIPRWPVALVFSFAFVVYSAALMSRTAGAFSACLLPFLGVILVGVIGWWAGAHK